MPAAEERLLPYRPLGALRLFLALLVMLQHYLQWCYPGPVQHAVMIFEPGNVAVLVFFFLSGFVITEAADLIYNGRPFAFFVNRLLRIVPLFAAAILVSFAALFLLSHFVSLTDEARCSIDNPVTASNLLANLMAIVPLPGRLVIEPSFNVLRIAWALRVEMAFYGCVALLLFASFAWRKLSFQASFTSVSTVLLALSAWYLLRHPPWNPLIISAPYFCAGGAFFFALKGSTFSRLIFVVAIVLCIVAQLDGSAASGIGATIAPTALFVVLTAAGLVLAARTSHHRKIDRWLGDYSYPVYVGHWLPLLLFAALAQAYPSVDGATGRIATTILGLAISLFYFLTLEPVMARVRAVIRGVAIR